MLYSARKVLNIWVHPQELAAAKATAAESAKELSATQAQHLTELANEAQSKRDLHERSASIEEVQPSSIISMLCWACPKALTMGQADAIQVMATVCHLVASSTIVAVACRSHIQ